MAKGAETDDDLDRLLRQGVRDVVEGATPSEGAWSKLRGRIEREQAGRPPDPTALNERRLARLPAVTA